MIAVPSAHFVGSQKPGQTFENKVIENELEILNANIFVILTDLFVKLEHRSWSLIYTRQHISIQKKLLYRSATTSASSLR
jgi:hypothetical protein